MVRIWRTLSLLASAAEANGGCEPVVAKARANVQIVAVGGARSVDSTVSPWAAVIGRLRVALASGLIGSVSDALASCLGGSATVPLSLPSPPRCIKVA
jgi:hypothetical protein